MTCAAGASLLGAMSTSRASTASGSARVSLETQPAVTTSADSLPPHLNGVGIDEHIGAQVPFDLTFLDESGKSVRLGNFFDGTVPVIVTLNYSNCPMLCSLQLSGLVQGLKKVDLTLGQSYRVITVSLDPHETPATARQTQARYLLQYGHPEATSSWHFLTGTDESIHALARAAGFNYRYDAKQGQYYHAAAIAIASPKGKLMRYLYGIEYAPTTLKLGLLESAQGRIGTSVNKLLLFCSAYNPKQGGYSAVASRIVSLGGLFTMVVLGGFLLVFWRREAPVRH